MPTYRLGKCNCCGCVDGKLIDRWLNHTLARKTLDCDYLETVNEVAPFARFVTGLDYVACTVPSLLTKVPPDWMGGWLLAGDMNGYSTQVIDRLVDDILSCGTETDTHTVLDHNCYDKEGTVDQRSPRRGRRSVLGKKHWQGADGVVDQSDPEPIKAALVTEGLVSGGGGFSGFTTEFNRTASQVRWLKIERHAKHEEFSRADGTSDPFVSNKISELEGTGLVGRYTGLRSKSGSGTLTVLDALPVWDLLNDDWNGIYAYFAGFTAYSSEYYPDAYVVKIATSETLTVQLWAGINTALGYSAPDYLKEEITLPLSSNGGGFSRKLWRQKDASTVLDWVYETASVSNTTISYGYQKQDNISGGDGDEFLLVKTGEIIYSDPYTSAMCKADLFDAWKKWNLANDAINALKIGDDWTTWMKSEALALSPLVIYDELGPTAPETDYNPFAYDYALNNDATDSEGRNPGDSGYEPTWHKRDWFDPAGYIWQYPDGSRSEPEGFTGGAELKGAGYKGYVIAAGIEGGERLFWFNAENYERVYDDDLGDPAWHWNKISTGALSDSRLPEATRRWMNPDEAQYDSAAFRGEDTPVPSGNYPQAFLRQQNGVLIGAKYIEATQSWPAVDFNYPCGDARFDVDQTSVCCITGGDAGSGFTVKQTGNATTDIVHDDYLLIEGDGIYQADTVTDLGGGNFTITVGSKIDDIPTGRSCLPKDMDALGLYSDGATHLGKLRWWTESPTTCVTPNPVSNKTGVRREYTFNNRAAHLPTGDQPLWLGGTVAGDGLGLVGCTGLTMAEFTFTSDRCPAAVGYVPFYSQIPDPDAIPDPDDAPPAPLPVENFANQTLFPMAEEFQFDDTFGALWLGQIDLVMVDPFWQDPFMPDCGIDYTEDPRTEFLTWSEDSGSGTADYDTGGTEEVPPITHHAFFPHRKWVAARCSIPSGMTLPSGIELFYALDHIIEPADGVNVHYDFTSGGIVLGDNSGGYRDIERPWGFTARACGVGNRFGDFYRTFTNCP